MRRTTPRRGPRTPLLVRAALVLAAGTLSTPRARAADCASAAGLSPCFDANALWLPAGPARFLTLPDTRVTAKHRPSLGIASEWLHRPVSLHASSPDPEGRDVRVVEHAVDTTLFGAFGLLEHFELSLAVPLRVYQNGAGLGGVDTQAGPPIAHTVLRDPRLGVAYSLDEVVATRGLGLRLGFDLSLPLGDDSAFAGARSLVAVPTATVAYRYRALRASGGVGVRLRSAVDFGGVRSGNQGYLALALGIEVLDPGLLFFSLEAFALPPLSKNHASTAGAAVSDARLFPAEWIGAVHSSFGSADWDLGLGAGTGLPLSSETRNTSQGPRTTHFLGVTTPDFRALLVLRYTPAAAAPEH